MKYFLATLIIAITLPLVAQAEVRINEIAWMGVQGTNGQYGEWFELYNDGPESVSLSGWGLYKGDGTKLLILLSGNIPSRGYTLVERTTASMPDPVPSVSGITGAFGNNGLANTGEYLVLKNSSGTSVQSVNFSSGWPAGDNGTKHTMQYSGGSWITAVPTPGTPNAEHEAVSENESDSDYRETDSPETDDSDGDKENDEKEIRSLSLLFPKSDPHITLKVPERLYRGIRYEFSATVVLEHSEPRDGNFFWNFGDGSILQTDTLGDVLYAYDYPGTYTVTLAYHSAKEYSKPLVQSSAVITVLPPTITLGMINAQTIEISNADDASIDLSGWTLETSDASGKLPAFTMLAPHGSIAFPVARLGIQRLTTAELRTPEGNVVAALGVAPAKAQAVRSNRAYAKPVPVAVSESAEPDETVGTEVPASTAQTQQHRTKTIVIGAVILVGMALLLLLERLMARQE